MERIEHSAERGGTEALRKLSAVFAVGRNGEAALPDGRLPWARDEELRAEAALDMAHFRRLTLNHTVIMGRVTYEAIGHPLEKRANIVVSARYASAPPEGVRAAPSLEAALAAVESSHAYLIGGETLLSYAFEHALVDEIYESVFDKDFPDASGFIRVPRGFVLEARERHGRVTFNFYKNQAYPKE